MLSLPGRKLRLKRPILSTRLRGILNIPDSCVAVKTLPLNSDVEIECVAIL